MNVLFLDIDGVLITTRSLMLFPRHYHYRNGEFETMPDPLSIHAVRHIVQHTGCKVVINSTKAALGEDRIRDVFMTAEYDVADDLSCHWRTQFPHEGFNRSESINEYVKIHGIENWCVIDDDDLTRLHEVWFDREFHVKTNPDDGITIDNVKEACRILGNPMRSIISV